MVQITIKALQCYWNLWRVKLCMKTSPYCHLFIGYISICNHPRDPSFIIMYNVAESTVDMKFDCYIKWLQLDSHSRRFTWQVNEPMLGSTHALHCEENCIISPRCWLDINLHSVYNWENGLLSLLQFSHIKINIYLEITFLTKDKRTKTINKM